MIARYRALFSAPGVGRLLFSSVVGRLPSGMFSLAILLFVHGSTDSFLAAGVAVGAFSLAGAVIGPLLGAQVDRHGQTRVLLGAALAQAGLLVALVLVSTGGRTRGGHRCARGARGRRAAADRGLRARAVVGGCRRGGAADRLRPGCEHAGDDLDARAAAGGVDGGVRLARRGGAVVRRADRGWGVLLRDFQALPRLAARIGGSARAGAHWGPAPTCACCFTRWCSRAW